MSEDFVNRDEFIIHNDKAFFSLKDFLQSVTPDNNYFVMGSLSLIAHTQSIGYFRKIKDVDIICDNGDQKEIARRLFNKGYSQSTFIDNKTPFSRILKTRSHDMYLRFYKSGQADIEVLFTKIRGINDIDTEVLLYPGIWFHFPKSEFTEVELAGIIYKTVTPELLYLVKNFGKKSVGRISKIGMEKRLEDIISLRRSLNTEKLTKLKGRAYLRIFKFKIYL